MGGLLLVQDVGTGPSRGLTTPMLHRRLDSRAPDLPASAVFRVKDELALDHSGQYAAFGRFQYS